MIRDSGSKSARRAGPILLEFIPQEEGLDRTQLLRLLPALKPSRRQLLSDEHAHGILMSENADLLRRVGVFRVAPLTAKVAAGRRLEKHIRTNGISWEIRKEWQGTIGNAVVSSDPDLHLERGTMDSGIVWYMVRGDAQLEPFTSKNGMVRNGPLVGYQATDEVENWLDFPRRGAGEERRDTISVFGKPDEKTGIVLVPAGITTLLGRDISVKRVNLQQYMNRETAVESEIQSGYNF